MSAATSVARRGSWFYDRDRIKVHEHGDRVTLTGDLTTGSARELAGDTPREVADPALDILGRIASQEDRLFLNCAHEALGSVRNAERSARVKSSWRQY